MVEAPASPPASRPRRGRLKRFILILALLSLVFVGLWGFVPIHVDEDVPATLKVMGGQVTLKRKAQGEWRQPKGIASLSSGSSVLVEVGGEAFIFFHTLFSRSNSMAQLMAERGALVLGILAASLLLGVATMLYSRRRA